MALANYSIRQKKPKKEDLLPRAGIEPATFRLYVYTITAERHIQLDHRGFLG